VTDLSRAPGRLARAGVLLARLVLAGVFLAAAAPKVADPQAFSAAIANYRVFPDAFLNVIATVVPALELVGALAVLTGWRLRGGAVLLGGLLLGFTGLLAASLARGLDLDCGCFGRADQTAPVSPLHLLRNVGLLALAGVVLVFTRRGPVVDRPR
jgi:putative oxidoreductase